jgi:hypothetical protein
MERYAASASTWPLGLDLHRNCTHQPLAPVRLLRAKCFRNELRPLKITPGSSCNRPVSFRGDILSKFWHVQVLKHVSLELNSARLSVQTLIATVHILATRKRHLNQILYSSFTLSSLWLRPRRSKGRDSTKVSDRCFRDRYLDMILGHSPSSFLFASLL